jgi:hypothetical protein
MKNAPYLRPLDMVVRAAFGAALVVSAIFIFKSPAAQLFIGLLGAWMLIEAITGRCLLQSRFKAKSFAEWVDKEPLLPLIFIQFILAYEWWSSGWFKLTSVKFLPSFMGTLTNLAEHNPYPWMQSFLTGPYLNGAGIVASLMICGELFGAIALAVSGAMYLWSRSAHVRFAWLVLASLALTGFLVLNGLFYFAAGWTDVSTRGVNVVMFGIQAILLYTYGSLLSEKKVS